MTIQDFIEKYNIKEENGRYYYYGNLNLRDTLITQLPDNLTVSRSLDLSNTPIAQLPKNLVVGECLKIDETLITELPDNLIVGYTLNLSGTQITQLPDNLTVGGWLVLLYTQIRQLPDNLTVGRYIMLSRPIAQPHDNLTVGKGVSFCGVLTNSYTYKILPENHILTWQDEKYIKTDGIFYEVIEKNDNQYVVREIGGKDLIYLDKKLFC